MEKEEELVKRYQRERAELEEEEDSVKRFMRRGEDYTQDVLAQVRQLLVKRETPIEVVRETQRAIQKVEADYLEELTKERKELIVRQEEVEQAYRKDYHQLKG